MATNENSFRFRLKCQPARCRNSGGYQDAIEPQPALHHRPCRKVYRNGQTGWRPVNESNASRRQVSNGNFS